MAAPVSQMSHNASKTKEGGELIDQEIDLERI